ncbi:hypothetical protein RHSIM_Rhsim04G0210400 [Rhododendron simsii]|uniref:PH domain-containing protein n=1 Tax=Rhododendron simsii TaxID=118357 RepID=A0A834H217_RHOSS|nr:hypothetical protein RHSIM_Rhsim04G0210400 [Rhododendron simsii]
MGRSKKLMGDAIKSVDPSGKTSYMNRPDPEKQAERAERDDEESRKRKREKKDAEKKKWEKELKGRKYTCERQVDRSKMGTHAIIDIINQRGLQFFFKPIKGYKPKLVLDFYSNMEIDESEERIESKLGKKTVLVTPTIIAKYLDKYKRPSHGTTTYPATAWSKTEEEIQQALTDKPLKTDRFVHGKLFEKFRVINKVVHYNLFPHGSEKRPRKEDGEIIFVFGSSEEVVDWAKFIWNQMVKFRTRPGPSRANIPFPAMVTFICEDQGVLTPERLFPGTPGPITGGSLEKSKSLSQPPPSSTSGFRMPTARTQAGRIEEYMEVMATQLQSMQAKQNKLETHIRRTRRDVSAIKRGMLWIAARCGREGDVYVPTEADMRESTPEEPEREQGVGTSGGGDSSIDDGLCLWNPSVRMYRKFSKPKSTRSLRMMYALGYDSINDDFKVVSALCPLRKARTIVHVFSSKLSSWKSIGDFDYSSYIHGQGNVLDGAPHCSKSFYSIDYQAPDHTVAELEMPCKSGVEICGSLNGVILLDIDDESGVKIWGEFYSQHLEPLCFTKGGEVIMKWDLEKLVIYNPKQNTYKRIGIPYDCKQFDVTLYVESLVSPHGWNDTRRIEKACRDRIDDEMMMEIDRKRLVVYNLEGIMHSPVVNLTGTKES